jgi:hypothetical protein
MLLRTCPRCGDFYADDAPPFCPSDGAPLADVDPRAEGWEEGARVVEEKARLLHRRTRRLKLRRVLTALMTVTVTTLIVFVVMANAVIYLRPGADAPADVASAAQPPTTTPARGPTHPAPPPEAVGTTVIPFVPAEDPPPDGAATPDPSRTNTPTPTPDDTSTPDETGTPTTPTPTPGGTTAVEPSITPTPTPTPTTTVVVTTHSPPPPPPPPPPPTCTGDDKRALRAAVAARSSRVWEEAIGRDREEIVRAYTRRGAARVGVNLFGPVVYNVSFTKTCAPVSASAVYMWSVRWGSSASPTGPRPTGRGPTDPTTSSRGRSRGRSPPPARGRC